MAFTLDGILDPDESLRLLDALSGESNNDFAMLIENKGTPIEGESTRVYEDGKSRLDIGGYYLLSQVHIPPGSSKGKIVSYPMIVVRDCDAATASVASLLKSQDSELKVTLSVFKAGGDSSADMQPTLELVMEGARVTTQVILTGGQPKKPREIIYFNYRKLELRSAPQRNSGQRGAVRTCAFVNA